MSDHLLDDLIERSVRFVDTMPGPPDRRSMDWNLYQFADEHDTNFTRMRVIDLLLEHRFAYAFPIAEHPDRAPHAAQLAQAGDVVMLNEHVDEPWDEDENPVAGYTRDGTLYCEVGSPLWHRFVATGKLVGADAEPPRLIELIDLAFLLFDQARQVGEVDFIASWYPYVQEDLGPQLKSLARAQRIPGAARLRQIAIDTGAVLRFDYGGRVPPGTSS
jgi:hypothetical protein